jgi:glucosamine--fructose-6-phosphate aminotransferase (isomerizing)
MSDSHLARETAEQPDVAARILDRDLGRLDDLRAALRPDGVDGIVLVARGSSDNAARYAQYLWSIRTGMPVSLATPSLHTVYGVDVDLRRKAVVAISQSGTSPDVVTVMHTARSQGAPAVAITNDPGSPLADAASEVFDLAAGAERSVAATKTYTASLLAVALLGAALSEPSSQASDEAALELVPEALEAAVRDTVGVEDAAVVVEAAWRGVAVGRGLNMSTAFETALKITELSGSLVAPYSPADLMHGPVGAVGPDVPVILVAPDEPATGSVLEIAAEAARREAPVVVVGHEAVVATARSAGSVDAVGVVIPDEARVADWLTPLTAVVPGQLVARAVAERRGVDVDRPGGLSKVTLTS